MSECSKSGLRFLAAALIVGGSGFVAGLLLAPASGKETRRRLGWGLQDGRRILERRGTKAVEQVRDYVGEQIEQGKRALDMLASV